MKHAAVCILVLALFLTGASPAVAEDGAESMAALGERLLKQLWTDIRQGDVEALGSMTAEGFQSVHQFGANDKAREMALIAGLKIDSYLLSEIKVTGSDTLIVASYFVSVAETIEGERLSKTPAPRLTVFVKTDAGWQWLAHANLKPLEKK
jgi:hypothetical protein